MWQSWSKRTHRGLRSCVLYSLERAPKTGAELMDAVEGMSQGWWRPSPGSIYPLLEALADEGLVKKSADGRYSLSEEGKKEVSSTVNLGSPQPRNAKEVVAEMSHYVSYLEDISRSDGEEVRAQSKQIVSLRKRLGSLLEG